MRATGVGSMKRDLKVAQLLRMGLEAESFFPGGVQ